MRSHSLLEGVGGLRGGGGGGGEGRFSCSYGRLTA